MSQDIRIEGLDEALNDPSGWVESEEKEGESTKEFDIEGDPNHYEATKTETSVDLTDSELDSLIENENVKWDDPVEDNNLENRIGLVQTTIYNKTLSSLDIRYRELIEEIGENQPYSTGKLLLIQKLEYK